MKTATAAVRRPLCTYFSANPNQLEQELKWCFEYFTASRNIKPAKNAPAAATVKNIPFLLLPHGAIGDSGPLVAEALLRMDQEFSFFLQGDDANDHEHRGNDSITRNKSKRTIILIGTEHASTAHNFCCMGSFAQWQTPLGCVSVDAQLLATLSTILPVENEPFLQEHSIENQLPFLQYLSKSRNVDIQILPLSVRGALTWDDVQLVTTGTGKPKGKNFTKAIACTLYDYSKNYNVQLAVLATTDYSHVGPSYGIVPPGWPNLSAQSIPDYIRTLDQPLLQAIMSQDISQFYKRCSLSSMCGSGAALLWIQLHKCIEMLLQKRDVERNQGQPDEHIHLLRYIVGSDIGPPHPDQTGFATLMFSKWKSMT